MTKIQALINDMHNGNTAAIVRGVSSSAPIAVMNAIIAGTQRNLQDEAFIHGVKQASESDEILLNIPLKHVAAASLHLLGIQKYTGKDSMVLNMIDSKLNM